MSDEFARSLLVLVLKRTKRRDAEDAEEKKEKDSSLCSE